MTTDSTFKIDPDGWFELCRIGEFPAMTQISGKPQKVIQIIDEDRLKRILDAFKGNEVLIDKEHFSYDTSKASEAMGWIQELERRRNSIWARARWTETGKRLLEGGEYRYHSPVFNTEVIPGGDNRRYVVSLDTVGLTNVPNIKGLEKISNRKIADDSTSTQENKMKEILTALGLAEDASPADALAAIQKIKTDLEAARSENKKLTEELADADLKEFEGVVENKDATKKLLVANRAATIEVLRSIRVTPEGTIHNRATAEKPEFAAENAKATQLDSGIRAIMKRETCGYEKARELARQDPELLKLFN